MRDLLDNKCEDASHIIKDQWTEVRRALDSSSLEFDEKVEEMFECLDYMMDLWTPNAKYFDPKEGEIGLGTRFGFITTLIISNVFRKIKDVASGDLLNKKIPFMKDMTVRESDSEDFKNQISRISKNALSGEPRYSKSMPNYYNSSSDSLVGRDSQRLIRKCDLIHHNHRYFQHVLVFIKINGKIIKKTAFYEERHHQGKTKKLYYFVENKRRISLSQFLDLYKENGLVIGAEKIKQALEVLRNQKQSRSQHRNTNKEPKSLMIKKRDAVMRDS